MASDTNSSPFVVSEREAAFARFASRVLETLNEAVDHRRKEGITVTNIAEKIGCHKSSLSRTLNGNCRNLTLKTVSDILWATDFDPKDFSADPIESICLNWNGSLIDEDVDGIISYPTQSILLNENFSSFPHSRKFEKYDAGVVSG